MSQIELRGFPVSLEYWVEEYDYIYRVIVAMPCKDRDNGEDIKLFLYYSYLKENFSEAEAVRTALVESMAHEVDECLYLNNDRIFDPHDPEKAL